jgi:hypothetical protein
MEVEVFKGFTGQSAKLAVSFEIMCNVFCGKNCDKTLIEANNGNVFPFEVLRTFERKVKRLNKMENSEKKDKEIDDFQKKLFKLSK